MFHGVGAGDGRRIARDDYVVVVLAGRALFLRLQLSLDNHGPSPVCQRLFYLCWRICIQLLHAMAFGHCASVSDAQDKSSFMVQPRLVRRSSIRRCNILFDALVDVLG